MIDMRVILIIAVWLICALPAQGSDQARTLLQKGEYEQARAVALEANTIDGLTTAAESMAAQIMLMETDEPKDMAKDALDLMDDALERDPDNIEAAFLRALHMGFRTRSSSGFSIMFGGLLGKTYRSIEEFEQLAPNDPRADALYGAWHLGIVRAAGDGKFGADLATGMAHYDRAVAAMPDDIVVIGNYAFSLITLEEPALLPKANELLLAIQSIDPSDATEAETKRRMMTLLDVFNDVDALYERAEGLLNTEESED